MSDMVEGWQGAWTARLLATYQPVINKSVLFPGAPFTRIPDSSTRITAFLNYTLDAWSLGSAGQLGVRLQPGGGARHAGHQQLGQSPCAVLESGGREHLAQLPMEGAGMTAYFVVQNLFNAQPAYVPNGTIGQWYPVYTSGYSVQSPMGRYLTHRPARQSVSASASSHSPTASQTISKRYR